MSTFNFALFAPFCGKKFKTPLAAKKHKTRKRNNKRRPDGGKQIRPRRLAEGVRTTIPPNLLKPTKFFWPQKGTRGSARHSRNRRVLRSGGGCGLHVAG